MTDQLTDYSELRDTPSKFVEQILGVEPFSYQKEFLDTDSRHFAVASGRQVGKSRMCAWKGLQYAVTHADAQVLITAPSLRQSSMLFDTLKSEVEGSGLSDEDWGIDRETQTIMEFDNGSAIHCLPTGRTGDNIRGYSADLVIVDEASFIQDSIFEDILQPMLLATSGSLVLASTPWGTSGFFYRKWDQGDYDDTQWENLQVHSIDSPLIDEDDVEQMKQGKTEAQIDREIRGKFVEDGAQFFPTDPILDAMGHNENSPTGNTYLGCDIAAAGDDRTIFYGIDETGNVFLDDEVYDDMGVIEAAERIQALDRAFDFETIVVDRTGLGQGTVESLAQSASMERKLTDKYLTVQTKQDLYQGLKRALEDGILALPDNQIMREELEKIGYDKTKANNLTFEPREGGHDDHVDALALAVSALPEVGGDVPRGERGSTKSVTVQSTEPHSRSGTRGSPSRRRNISQR